MPSMRILRAMDFGAMMTVAYPLRREEREAVASFLGRNVPAEGPPPQAFCRDRGVKFSTSAQGAWNGWSVGTANTRFQQRKQPG